jgi:hypothetical protein
MLPISRYHHCLCADEISLQLRLAIFEQHFNYFPKINIQFIKRFALRLCARKSRHIANVQFRVRTSLDNRSKDFHGFLHQNYLTSLRKPPN